MPNNDRKRQVSPALKIVRRALLALVAVMLILAGIYAWPWFYERLDQLSVLALQAGSPPATLIVTIPGQPSLTPIPTLSATPRPPDPTASPLSTAAPVMPFANLNDSLIVLAIGEGGYTHLFAYQPGDTPFIRITTGDWHDITPAISPDGKTLAFASNRAGHWDLYLMDLSSGQVARLTNTPEYDAHPSWSPDSQWLAYETLVEDVQGSNLEILIRPLDGSQEPIRLTDNPGQDYDPAWSPLGRKIAFVSDRDTFSEIWLADLDQVENRYENISLNRSALDAHPAWSPDGQRISWASTSTDGIQNLYVWDLTQPTERPRLLNTGDWNVWSPEGNALLASLSAPNQVYLTGYDLGSGPYDSSLILPILKLNSHLAGMSWGKAILPKSLPLLLAQAVDAIPTPVWSPVIDPQAGMPGNRMKLVQLEDVDAPNPVFQDQVDESFQALRQRVTTEVGWDFLSALEQAYVPLTARLGPGMSEDWLYTGRAFRFSSAPINAGWVVMAREDYGPLTYWRIFLRTRFQDGSQGTPLFQRPWDLYARSGDPRAYEQGGALETAVPTGYWLDFTQLAAAFGWERQSALPIWRLAISASRFNEFILPSGLDWLAAMMEIYPREALNTSTPVPSPTNTLPPSITPTKTLTPTNTPWLSRTPTPTKTPWPTRTSTPTRTPTPTPRGYQEDP